MSLGLLATVSRELGAGGALHCCNVELRNLRLTNVCALARLTSTLSTATRRCAGDVKGATSNLSWENLAQVSHDGLFCRGISTTELGSSTVSSDSGWTWFAQQGQQQADSCGLLCSSIMLHLDAWKDSSPSTAATCLQEAEALPCNLSSLVNQLDKPNFTACECMWDDNDSITVAFESDFPHPLDSPDRSLAMMLLNRQFNSSSAPKRTTWAALMLKRSKPQSLSRMSRVSMP